MGHRRYAKGYNSKAECMRCGDKMNYSDLLDDAQVPGLRVCGDCWDSWHPQLDPIPADDAIALWRPSPDVSIAPNYKVPGLPICFNTQGDMVFPSASFTSVVSGPSATFTNTTNPECVTESSWAWTFGDGAASALENPVHGYATSSTFTVSLTTTFSDGSLSTFISQVTASAIWTDWVKLADGLGYSGSLTSFRRTIGTDNAGTWISMDNLGRASKSVDNGLVWTTIGTQFLNSGGFTANRGAIATNGSGTWMIAFNEGWASRSVDGGVNWAAMTRYLNSNALSADIFRIVYVGGTRWVGGMTAGYSALSTDDGVTWAETSSAAGGVSLAAQDLAWDGATTLIRAQGATTAARSLDNGSTWINSAMPISCISVASYGVGKFVGVSVGQFTVTIDHGLTWSAAAAIGTLSGFTQNIRVAPAGQWLVSTGNTVREIWYSIDEGANWIDATSTLPTIDGADTWWGLTIGQNNVAIMTSDNAYSIRSPST